MASNLFYRSDNRFLVLYHSFSCEITDPSPEMDEAWAGCQLEFLTPLCYLVKEPVPRTQLAFHGSKPRREVQFRRFTVWQHLCSLWRKTPFIGAKSHDLWALSRFDSAHGPSCCCAPLCCCCSEPLLPNSRKGQLPSGNTICLTFNFS